MKRVVCLIFGHDWIKYASFTAPEFATVQEIKPQRRMCLRCVADEKIEDA